MPNLSIQFSGFYCHREGVLISSNWYEVSKITVVFECTATAIDVIMVNLKDIAKKYKTLNMTIDTEPHELEAGRLVVNVVLERKGWGNKLTEAFKQKFTQAFSTIEPLASLIPVDNVAFARGRLNSSVSTCTI